MGIVSCRAVVGLPLDGQTAGKSQRHDGRQANPASGRKTLNETAHAERRRWKILLDATFVICLNQDLLPLFLTVGQGVGMHGGLLVLVVDALPIPRGMVLWCGFDQGGRIDLGL